MFNGRHHRCLANDPGKQRIIGTNRHVRGNFILKPEIAHHSTQPLRRGISIASGDIDVSRNRHQRGDSPDSLNPVGRVVHGDIHINAGRFTGRIHTSHIPDFRRRNPGYGLNLLRRIRLDMLDQLIKTDGPFSHKIPVIQPFGNYYIKHTKSQGTVGSRSNLGVYIGPFGQLNRFRVDNNKPGSVPDPGINTIGMVRHKRFRRIITPDHHASGLALVMRVQEKATC